MHISENGEPTTKTKSKSITLPIGKTELNADLQKERQIRMKNNKPLNLTDYLSIGEQNAITAKELARLLGLNEREITYTVNALRKKGVLICSNTQSGFFFFFDDTDIKDFVRQMNSRIIDMQKAMNPAVEYLNNGGGSIC